MSENDKPVPPEKNVISAPPERVEFHYIKNNAFRVIHSDGVIGQITPKRQISLSLFSERPAIPKTIEYEIDKDGELSELNRITRKGYVREIDVNVMLDLETAKEIRDLLNQIIIDQENDPDNEEIKSE